jgi:hypothetical protein
MSLLPDRRRGGRLRRQRRANLQDAPPEKAGAALRIRFAGAEREDLRPEPIEVRKMGLQQLIGEMAPA